MFIVVRKFDIINSIHVEREFDDLHSAVAFAALMQASEKGENISYHVYSKVV